jgi:hypothetical protein
MVGDHPAIGQINAFLELNRDHFWIYLHHDSFQPIAYPLVAELVITKDLYPVANII